MARTRIVIPLYDGVTHLDFTGPHQVLVRAPDAEVVVASFGGRDIKADGLTFASLADLREIDRCDVLCVPGGLGTVQAMLDEPFMAEIRRLGAGAKYLTSVCTGSLILGAAGFLKGRRAACHWGWRDLLPYFGAVVGEERVVRDGDIITGGGVTAGIDFAFVLLAELAGVEHAQKAQLSLEYAPVPPFDAGRPESAPPAIVEALKAGMGDLVETRRQAAVEAAARMPA